MYVSEDQIEELYDKLDNIDRIGSNQPSTDLGDYTIAYISNTIENRIKSSKQFKCTKCECIFDENLKSDMFDGSNFLVKPCCSTFTICKQADRFMKETLLNGTIDFNVILHEILQCLNVESLYTETDFTDHLDHKVYLIRFVVNEYIKIKGMHIAKSATSREQEKSVRSKLHKLLHFLGQ